MPPTHKDLVTLLALVPAALFAAGVALLELLANGRADPWPVALTTVALTGALMMALGALLEAIAHPPYLWVWGVSGVGGFFGTRSLVNYAKALLGGGLVEGERK